MNRFRASSVVLGLLCLMYLITYLDRVNVSTAADGFAREFRLSKTQIGLVFSAFASAARKTPKTLAATTLVITVNVVFIDVLPMAFKVCD